MFDGVNAKGLSRKAVFTEVENSLKRLQTDYIDLYIIHRWDYTTPIEETMEALHELVKVGKVRALGASANVRLPIFITCSRQPESMDGLRFLLWKIITTCFTGKMNGNCSPSQANECFLIPYSPLAAGHLARAQWKSNSLRSGTDQVAMGKYDKTEAEDMQIVKRVAELAEKYNCKMSQIAIAWQWAKGILSPIIGATKTQYLDDSAGTFDIKLTAEDLAYLEEPYVPHEIVGAIDKNPAQGVILLDEKK